MSMSERFEILRGPDPDRFALRFVFGNGDKRFIGTDYRRKGDARNVARSIENACLAAAARRIPIVAATLAGSGYNLEVRDLTLLDDDGRPSPYHRANRGVVHLETCGFSRLARSTPWAYVRHWTPAAVITEVESLPWLRLCQRCWPPLLRSLEEAQVQPELVDA